MTQSGLKVITTQLTAIQSDNFPARFSVRYELPAWYKLPVWYKYAALLRQESANPRDIEASQEASDAQIRY
jgi:hypothetical protein